MSRQKISKIHIIWDPEINEFKAVKFYTDGNILIGKQMTSGSAEITIKDSEDPIFHLLNTAKNEILSRFLFKKA